MILLIILIALIWVVIYITSGKKEELSEHTVIKTKKSVQEVVDSLRQSSSMLKANVDKIQDDPFGEYGVTTDVAVVLHGSAKSQDIWVVQVYVTATEDGCHVDLIALGENLPSAYTGSVYTGRIDMKTSRRNKDIIAGILQ